MWGRPLNGTAAKYLGTGLLQCGCCGAGLEVRSRAHGKRASGYKRVHFYACSAYWRKGTSICRNGAEIRMSEADRLILDLAERTLLHPAVLERAIQGGGRISGRGHEVEVHRSGVVAAIADTDRELLHLTSAIAAGGGGNVASIIEAMAAPRGAQGGSGPRVGDARRADRDGALRPGYGQVPCRRRSERLADHDSSPHSAGAIDAAANS